VEARTGLSLADSQKTAIRVALRSKVMVITGGPGVGKTTLVNSILRILAAKKASLLLCAPTGRAAKRMTETTGYEVRPCSSSAISISCRQSVPALADIIASGVVPVARLTEVFRQAAQSQIVQSAHKINAGQMPDLSAPQDATDFYFISASEPDIAVTRLIELVKERIPRRFGFDPMRDIQVLCPMNRGGLGARSLNIELQRALNPPEEPKVEKFGTTFAISDKVMQVENDYDKEVYNGDMATSKPSILNSAR
jgi:exodeoxyribonuclease V alpha subunit